MSTRGHPVNLVFSAVIAQNLSASFRCRRYMTATSLLSTVVPFLVNCISLSKFVKLVERRQDLEGEKLKTHAEGYRLDPKHP